jgi:hypothetical protein
MADELLKAEVLLREPGAAGKVGQFLRDQGIEVSATGAASISIRTDRETFARVFGVHPRDAAAGDAREGTHDFGPAGGQAGTDTDGPAVIPDAIAGDVEGVFIQQSPRFLG